jgi:hypothetical protein
MTQMRLTGPRWDKPLDVVEHVVSANEWLFDRPSDEEIAAQVPGRWCDYNLYFRWNEFATAMQFTLTFDTRIPANKFKLISELLALVNDKVWIGHFTIWQEEKALVYRHVLPLRGSDGPTIEQSEDLVNHAIMESDRFYPAVHYVLWGGKSPGEAVDAAMLETMGEA